MCSGATVEPFSRYCPRLLQYDNMLKTCLLSADSQHCEVRHFVMGPPRNLTERHDPTTPGGLIEALAFEVRFVEIMNVLFSNMFAVYST